MTHKIMPTEWTKTRIGSACSVAIGGTPSRDKPEFWDREKETNNLWVSIRDLSKKYIDDTAEYISYEGVRKSNVKRVPKGTTLMSFKLTIGRVAVAHRDLYTNEAIVALTPNDSLSSEYLYYGLQFWDLLQGVDQAIKGATLNKAKIKQITIFFPNSLQEQQWIAAALSTIDETIERTEAVIVKLTQIKQGLMQDLLTRGIDEKGNIRSEKTHKFKSSQIGQIPQEWDEVSVEHAGTVTLGRQRSPAHQKGPHLRPYLRVANVFDGWIDYSDVLQMNFSPAEQVTFSLIPGDILLNEGQSLELVGRSAIFDGPQKTYCFQNTLLRFRCNETTIPPFCQFVFKFWLDTSRFQLVAKQTTSVAHLGSDRFAKMPFARPDRDEQKRIAAALQAQADCILVETKRLAKLRRLRIGLMQDLLSGKVRVNHLLKQ